MFNIRIVLYLKLIFFISLIAIISAYFIEYVLGHQPCNLCLIERIPYLLAMILIVVNYFFLNNEKFLILLLVVTFIFSLSVSIYHFGIENDFFEESAICKLQDLTEFITKEEILEQLKVKTVSCKDVTFKIFGFSLTTINIFLNLFIIILLINIYKNYEMFKK
ncbi:disulfide bond formation protein B [Pelagibacterales bacterium SAG-MED13]|nr:disulfide bond formation protein B [Pelagibacterales bacterium SAG-MED13]|tara:strand:+ start:298 stop:786 length:489 start_codon:yes stop_codon:yes gene_type:complete